jgi:hypothetical protein
MRAQEDILAAAQRKNRMLLNEITSQFGANERGDPDISTG